jgi:hypothetical protein
MFLDKLIAAIGHFFRDLFDAAKKAYNNLSPDVQNAMLNGAGVISLVNSMLDKTPAEIRAAIQAQFPNLNETQLEQGLLTMLHTFNVAPNTNSLEDAIEALKNYLSTHSGGTWETVSHSLGVALAALFAPANTKLATITSLIEFVYQHFIKKQ